MPYFPKPEHTKIMNEFFVLIKNEVNYIADIGTGRTSLYTIAKHFGYSKVDAYYNDQDLKVFDVIKDEISKLRYNFVKMDITSSHCNKHYDLGLSHLVITRGKSAKQDEQSLIKGIFSFKCKYLVIIEEKSGISDIIFDFARKYGYKLLKSSKSVNTMSANIMRTIDYDIGYLFEYVGR